MQFDVLHAWNLAPTAAVALQKRLTGQVRCEDRLPRQITSVAGVDVSCRLHSRLFHAAVVVFSYPKLELIETATASMETDFPYVPGLLSFRELPVVLKAVEKLQITPELLLVDGQGRRQTVDPIQVGLGQLVEELMGVA